MEEEPHQKSHVEVCVFIEGTLSLLLEDEVPLCHFFNIFIAYLNFSTLKGTVNLFLTSRKEDIDLKRLSNKRQVCFKSFFCLEYLKT